MDWTRGPKPRPLEATGAL